MHTRKVEFSAIEADILTEVVQRAIDEGVREDKAAALTRVLHKLGGSRERDVAFRGAIQQGRSKVKAAAREERLRGF